MKGQTVTGALAMVLTLSGCAGADSSEPASAAADLSPSSTCADYDAASPEAQAKLWGAMVDQHGQEMLAATDMGGICATNGTAGSVGGAVRQWVAAHGGGVTVTFPPTASSDPDPASPTASPVAPEQPAPPPADDGVTCREFLLASDADAQALWSQAAAAANRPQVAAWGGRMNGMSVCQDDPDRSLVSVAKVVSQY